MTPRKEAHNGPGNPNHQSGYSNSHGQVHISTLGQSRVDPVNVTQRHRDLLASGGNSHSRRLASDI
jgi:hypothetical protein